jgi:hypothetical protein
MTRELRFMRVFGAAEGKTYTRLPFEVTEDAERIEVEYSYPRFESEARPEGRASVEANVVDLGLYDEKKQLRGWSGSERPAVYVSSNGATPGYRSGPVGRGTWAVALGLYKIRSRVEVAVTVRIVGKEPVLLAGDLHMHTDNSDGAYSTQEVIRQCKIAGLDFIALTDHNNTAQNEEIGRPEGIVVIPGMEYTNYRGHANFLFRGGSDFRVDPLANNRGETAAVFRAAREAGAVISLNHTHCDTCPWEFGFDDLPYDMAELWNGAMKGSELRAVAWWQGLLASGRRLPAVGGSDMHRHEMLRSYGSPTTFVRAASRSREDILDALVAGRSSISATREGPRAELSIGDAEMGGEAAPEKGLEGRVRVEGALRGDLVRVVGSVGEPLEWDSPFDGEFTAAFPSDPRERFYRAEVWRSFPLVSDRMLFALTNPVYIKAAED